MQPHSNTSAAPVEPPTAKCGTLLDLPRDVTAIIMTMLTRDAVRAFAATSTAAFTLVLDQRADLVEFRVASGLVRVIARLSGSVCQRSILRTICYLPPPSEQPWHLRMPLHAAVRVYSSLGGCASAAASVACTKSGEPLLLVLMPATMRAVLPCITCVECNGEAPDTLLAVPPGMAALQEVKLHDCKLRVHWLYASSAVTVRVLDITGSSAVRLPEGMRSLTQLSARFCKHLCAEWLPASSAENLRHLNIAHSPQPLERLPAGVTALEYLDATDNSLSADWLPLTCKATLHTLLLAHSTVQRIPDGLTALRRLDVSHCDLADDWLPPGNRASLLRLVARSTRLVQLPEGLLALRELDIAGCKQLGDNWLPEGCAAGIRVLKASRSMLRKVPEEMAVLQEVDLSWCKHLTSTPLSESSAALVCSIDVSGTPVLCLPEGMLALESANVSSCRDLAPLCWLPASSAARLHTLRADNSSMRRVPTGTVRLRELWIHKSECPARSISAAVLCSLEKLNGHAVHHNGQAVHLNQNLTGN